MEKNLSHLLGGRNDAVCNTANNCIMRDKPNIAIYFAQLTHSIFSSGTYNLQILLVLKYHFIHKNKIQLSKLSFKNCDFESGCIYRLDSPVVELPLGDGGRGLEL